MEWCASWNEDHEEQLSFPLTKLSDLSLDFARGFSLVFPIVRLVESRATTSFQKKAAQVLTRIRQTLPEDISCSAEAPSSAQHALVECTEAAEILRDGLDGGYCVSL